MGSTYTKLLYHVVFSTKHRLPFITPKLKPDLHAYMGGIIRELDGTALEINGIADHVHLILALKPVHAISDVIQTVKANASKWVNKSPKLAERFEWQIGFSAFTISESQLAKSRQYVKNQEDHHKKMTFKQELITLLKRHQIEYDPRYVFE